MSDTRLLSFVIPCYRSEKTIKKVIDEIISVTMSRPGYDYEVIAVNDCSPDGVYDVLCDLAKENQKIKVVNFVRNMGKHTAVLAGYSYVTGDYVVNLDDDYQSPVDHLWELMDQVEDGQYDIAMAKYNEKKESAWKRFGSNVNLWISEIMLDKPKGMRFENLSVMKRFVADEMLNYKNPYPFLEGLMFRVTGNVVSIPMDQRERGDDRGSGFTFFKSLSLFANGFTNFSVKPLRIALFIGVLFAIAGFIYGIYVVIKRLLIPETPMGWSSIMAVLLFSSGIVMVLLGIIGEYVGRIFMCINHSSQYVIRNTVNIEDKRIKDHQGE